MSADDPFDTSGIREAVLESWESSATRFREDANAEEDLVLGGYRDRLIVELIQNALDAAAPNPGHVRIVLNDEALIVANAGRPLTHDGVQALSSLRASSKRDDDSSIGKFGVGFAAVLAITDAPLIVSSSGCVGFSLGRTRSLVGSIAGLGSELSRREGRVPVLRLPFVPVEVPEDTEVLVSAGWASVIRLPFRDATARELSLKLLEELDPALPVVLDGFGKLEIAILGRDERVIERTVVGSDGLLTDVEVDGVRWRIARASGQLDARLRDERSIEDRGSRWWASAAVSIDDAGAPTELPRGLRQVMRAPQETQEELTVPMVLSASYPLDADRRRIRSGEIADVVTGGLAAAAVTLMEHVAPGRAMLNLVARGLPRGALDSSLRDAIERLLPTSSVLPEGARIVLDLGHGTLPVAALVAEVTDEFLPGDWPASDPAYDALGVRRLDTRGFVEWLIENGPRPPAPWWARLVAALIEAPDRDALSALPVPLADGGFAIGTRGVLQPESGLDVRGLVDAGVDLRILHPDAADPAWSRIGIELATASTLLLDERMRQAIADEAAALRDEESEPDGSLGAAVLDLVAGSGVTFAEAPWLQDVVLPSSDGSMWPAVDLLLPGSALLEVVEDPIVVATELVDRAGRNALQALGIADRFVVEAHEEGDEIRDLDLIRDDAWPRALEILAADPDTRRALLDRRGESSAAVEQLLQLVSIDGRLLTEFVSGSDPVLNRLFDAIPARLDAEVLAALGIKHSMSDLNIDEAWDALDRVGLVSTILTREQVRAAYTQLAALLRDSAGEAPLSVKAVLADALTVVPTKDVVVVDAPDLVDLIGGRPYVPVALSQARSLAQVLNVATASELGDYAVVSKGVDGDAAGQHYLHHEPLVVCDLDGAERSVEWRLMDGQIHASSVEGLGRALAFLEQKWGDRDAIIARLRSSHPEADADFDEL